jgi:hypothetical protein
MTGTLEARPLLSDILAACSAESHQSPLNTRSHAFAYPALAALP